MKSWTYKEFCNCNAVVEGDRIVCRVGLTADDTLPDQVDFDAMMVQSRKDAALIAAAPDLLEVLKSFIKVMDSLSASDETSLRVWDLYHDASKVIAKASKKD